MTLTHARTLRFSHRMLVGVRWTALAALLLLAAVVARTSFTVPELVAFACGLAAFALATVALTIVWFRTGAVGARVLWFVLPVDLLAAALFVIATPAYEDPFYPVFFVLVIVYAMALRRQLDYFVAFAAAATYLVGHLAGEVLLPQAAGLMHDIALGMKTLMIVGVGIFVATVIERYDMRERALEHSRADVEELNAQLRRTIGELHAVAEIGGVMHSSLELDVIAPVVLDALQRVVGMPACSLVVVDRRTGETLFSVSSREDAAEDAASSAAGREEPFTCLTLFDERPMTVMLFAAGETLDMLTADDRAVLVAVASELAMALDNSQLYSLTRQLAATDDLTGLANYRMLQQRLEEEFGRAHRYGHQLSLLMIDIDDFKRFNDSFGHVAGDQALAEVGRVLSANVRDVDLVARYGGEEFAVILPETDASGAFIAADKLREAIATHPFPVHTGTTQLTISVGIANNPIHALDREALLRAADGALYDAKHTGRNRVRVAQSLDGVAMAVDAAFADELIDDIEEDRVS